MNDQIKQWIEAGETALGIEMGSTRIKAVLIGKDHQPIASGNHEWKNRLEDGVWTYHLDDVWKGIQHSYSELCADVQKQYGIQLKTVGAIGVSAMMHGYLVFDSNDQQLVPFRTWRNTMTEEAASKLTEIFSFNIPQRWSVAHLYQAMLNKEKHVSDISFMTTLAGYVHWQLTGEKVLGIGDASGIFPIDSIQNNYDTTMMKTLNDMAHDMGYHWSIDQIMPKVLVAGENAGVLTAEGALRLDPTGSLQTGIPLCPPEGDAGTGMTATNSVAERTGNVSAGTSIFAMLVLEKALSKVYMEIDMVTTPTGKPVAMVHCNNCTSDIDAWVRLFEEFANALGCQPDKTSLYQTLYNLALQGAPDVGGLLAYNYYSGEPITNLDAGRPLFARLPDAEFNLPNFIRTLLYSTMATLKIGMDILTKQEKVHIDALLGHGGLFKIPKVGQTIMTNALNVPVSVMDSAAEGGAWGIALLAAFCKNRSANEPLETYLQENIFASANCVTVNPTPADVEGFAAFMERYEKGLAIEAKAVESLSI